MASSFDPLLLIVGLGNPGPQYARNRHNVGFWFVDRIADTRRESRYDADLGTTTIGGERVVLMKPMSYMNRSGGPVGAYVRFFKIPPAQILVVHDELDLAPGVARLKQGGGHGGHNGLRDIIAQLGAGFWRLRVGVGHPGSKDEVIDYVLERVPAAERTLIEAALARALDVVPEMVRDGTQKAMQRLHTRADNGS